MIRYLDHVNLRTSDVPRMLAFYEGVVGLAQGARPDLGFPGAWLYAGGRAVIHLVEVGEQPSPSGALRLEHFAFAGSELDAFLANLERHGVAYRRTTQPGTGATVINLKDPDGNRLHVDF